MVEFFIILAVLMVLVAAASQWAGGPRRRVRYEDEPVIVDRRPAVVVDEAPRARVRRVVRRSTHLR